MKTCLIIILTAVCLRAAFAQPQNQEKPRNPPPINERLERLSAELAKSKIELTVVEQQKLTDAFKVFFEGMDKLHAAHQRPDRTVVDALTKERDAAIKKSLSAGTFQKYLAISKTLLPKPPDLKE
jgi:deoxyribodipyrimidine photolyase